MVSVPLPLDGWLVPAGSAATITIIEPPIFGTWAQEVYTPSEEFWLAGGDRLIIEAYESTTQVKSRHVILINIAGSDGAATLEDFESASHISDLELDWDVSGASSMNIVQTQTPQNSYLEIDFSAGTTVAGLQDPSAESNPGVDHLHAGVVFNTSPPDDPRNPPGATGFSLRLLELGEWAYAELRNLNGIYEIRAVVDGLDCTVCATDWETLVPGDTHRLRMSIGRRTVQHPNDGTVYSLDIRYRNLETGWSGIADVQGLTVPATSQPLELTQGVGAFEGSGVGGITISYDEIKVQGGLLLPSELSNRVEGFDGGTWSPELLSVGPLGTVLRPYGTTNIGGMDDYWAGLPIGSLMAGGTDAQLLDLEPDQSSTLWAHMKLALGRLAMPAWSSFFLLEGLTDTDLSFMQLRVRSTSTGDLQIQARCRDGSGAVIASPWISFGADNVSLDMAWDAEGGSFDLWIDGQLVSSLDLLPGPYRIDEVQIGASNPIQGQGIIEVTTGFYIDDIVMLYE
ncbi:MAG: hypothetical protein AAGF23_04235 [Acidobacteriota bacterium]